MLASGELNFSSFSTILIDWLGRMCLKWQNLINLRNLDIQYLSWMWWSVWI